MCKAAKMSIDCLANIEDCKNMEAMIGQLSTMRTTYKQNCGEKKNDDNSAVSVKVSGFILSLFAAVPVVLRLIQALLTRRNLYKIILSTAQITKGIIISKCS